MDQKISQFTTALTLNGPDLFPIVQDGANKAITAGNLATRLAEMAGGGESFTNYAGDTIDVGTVTLVTISGINVLSGVPTAGQLIRFYSDTDGSLISFTNGVNFNQITLNRGGSCTIRYHATFGWFVESQNSWCVVETVV